MREEVLVQISAWCLNPILSSKAVMGEKKRVICPPHKNFQQKWENQSGKDTRLNIAGGRCQSGRHRGIQRCFPGHSESLLGEGGSELALENLRSWLRGGVSQ